MSNSVAPHWTLVWPAILALVDGALGITVSLICINRMRKLTSAHLLTARVAYAGMMTGGFCLAFAPLLFSPSYERLGATLFAGAVVAYMLSVRASWGNAKPPRYLERGRGRRKAPRKQERAHAGR